MPGLGARSAAATGSAVTPDREVEVHFDLDENVLHAPPFSLRRYGSQIVYDTEQLPAEDPTGTELLLSGYWILRPLQGRLEKLHETTEMGSATMLLSDFNAIPAVKQEPLYRTATEIPGLTTGAGGTLATSANDLFFTLRRTGGNPWNVSVFAVPPKVSQDENLVMDRVMSATTAHKSDQGYLLRWQCAGTQRHHPDNILTFYFGGSLFAEGYGQFALTFRGNGRCTLYEYHDGDWNRRLDWQYCQLSQVMSAAHTMRIFPHMFRYIQFSGETNERSEGSMLHNNRRLGPYASDREAPNAKLYIDNPSITGRPQPSPDNHVTGTGYVAVDVRRDMKLAWQISQLQFPPTATLPDMPFGLPCFVDSNALLKISTDYFLVRSLTPPTAGDVVAEVNTTPIDDETGLPLAGDADAGWSLPADPIKVAVQFEFTTTDILSTPFLRGYTTQLIGSVGTKVIGEKTGGTVMDYQITGPTNDPTHETASLHIEDAQNELESLRRRAGQNCRIQTSYDPNDPSAKSVLFYGRVGRTDAKLWGYDHGQEYPDPDWAELSVTLFGEFQRLYEQLMVGQFDFSRDETADTSEWVNGSPPAWKFSRIVEHLVSYCGYQTNQIDVAELDALGTRLPLDTEQGSGAAIPNPFTAVGDYLQRILRDFLGAYLLYDPNAENGAAFRGMWRVFFGARIEVGDTPLYSFSNDEPAAPSSGVTLLGRTEAYPANTTFIQRGSYTSWVLPPEANALLVTTTGDLAPDRAQTGLASCAINYRSYNPPGGPGLDDPDDPDNVDYLGTFVPLVITDPMLAIAPTAAERQAMLDLFTRHIYNIACRGAKRLQWESPLVLVGDATDTLLTSKRPLRYGDFVRVDGVDCILRSCDPSFQKDFLQFASYTADVYRAPE